KGTYERVVIQTTKEHEQREIIVVNLKKYPAKIKTPLSDGDEVNFFLIEEEFVNQISLQGAVKYPGNYEFKEGMRILDLFDGPNEINEDTYLGNADVYSFKDNFRDVSLKTIDLGKALKKDPQHNIKLKNLDKIIIYSKWDINYFREPVVHLFGAVQYPGFFPRSKGLTLSSLIRQAGGLLPQSHSLINVIRANGDQEVLTFNLDFNKFKLGGEKDILLEDGDIIAVKTNQPYRMDPETVTIEGEVKYPGVYPIKPGIERLEDLLKVAGGVLDSGWLPGITVMRKANEQITEKQKTNINAINAIVKYINQIKFEQTKRRHEYLLGKEGLGPDAGSAANTLNPTSRESALKGSLGITIAGSSQEVVGGAFDVGRETGSILTEARELSERDFITNEYVVLNFSGTELSSENNIVLQDKDVFSIPPKINTVEIVGAVYRPTRVFFHKNYDLEDYIDFVGGFTEDANSEKVIILRLNGAIIPADSIDQFNPGDVIFVPTKVISTEIKTSLDKILDVIRFTLVTLTSYWVLITLLAL
ncbi:MAG: SLBB domain-containing protein, partial [Deltaproteobacteria bacterium]|nr:SLBB domain-containing protein [Deltaproteobacteria bacterium]